MKFHDSASINFFSNFGRKTFLSNFLENTLKFSCRGGMIPIVMRGNALYHQIFSGDDRKRGEKYWMKNRLFFTSVRFGLMEL